MKKHRIPSFSRYLAGAILLSAILLILPLVLAEFNCHFQTALAQNSQGYSYGNPLTVNSFTALIRSVLTGIQGAVGWLAVIFIMVGGIMYIVSGGTQLTNMARATITWALAGFAIAVAAPTLMKEIWDMVSAGGSAGNPIPNAKPISAIVADALSFFLSLVGVMAIIGFAISGVLYVTAAGNQSQSDTARQAMYYTLIGIVVSGAGLVIVQQVIMITGGTF